MMQLLPFESQMIILKPLLKKKKDKEPSSASEDKDKIYTLNVQMQFTLVDIALLIGVLVSIFLWVLQCQRKSNEKELLKYISMLKS
jgi:hypothetical protein